MKLGKCSLTNFGSYSQLDFDYSNQGLALIHGPTGAGKSTLADAPCWVLFGQTAKGGAVDEVRSWLAPKAPTTGTLEITLPDSTTLTVTRVRGKAAENDLYWTTGDSDPVRGKDMAETQKGLELHLGVSAETYQTAAYFHEFSEAGAFFQAAAKSRRATFDRLSNLEFPTQLAKAATDRRKEAKVHLQNQEIARAALEGRKAAVTRSASTQRVSERTWADTRQQQLRSLRLRAAAAQKEQNSKIEALTRLSEEWQQVQDAKIENKRKEIQRLPEEEDCEKLRLSLDSLEEAPLDVSDDPCPTCGLYGYAVQNLEREAEISALKANLDAEWHNKRTRTRVFQELEALFSAHNPYPAQIDSLRDQTGRFDVAIEQWEGQTNPHSAQIQDLDAELMQVEGELGNAAKGLLTLQHRVASLSRLIELASDLRGALLQNAVSGIERETNRYLETYFDAELRVSFALEGSDSLKVELQKSGYACTYKQLSKGQRGLLKLCFVVSVISAAAQRHGVEFNALFLDESLDGLDAALKVKAFGLFTELSTKHESVFVIDHEAELKQLFDVKYRVSLEGDASILGGQDGQDEKAL